PRRPPAPERPLALLAFFLSGLLFTSLLTTGNLNFTLPGISSHFEGFVVGILEAAWFGLVPIGAGLMRARVVDARLPLALLTAGAVAAGSWVLLEAYGSGAFTLFAAGQQGHNLAGTLGHQAYVAAFTGVALSFWVVRHALRGPLSPLHVLVSAVLMAALVASGGRAGLLATLFVLAVATAYAWRHGRGKQAVALLLPVLAVGGLVTLTSHHAQKRVARIGTAIQGEDGSVNHRFIFWDIAQQAILDRPLAGYGAYALHYLAWEYASPEEARALLTEFLPRELAEQAVRIGKLAFYADPESGTLRVRVMNPYGVHNYLLDMALAHGLPTMVMFLAFLLSTASSLYRARTPVALAALAALGTYLLYGMFWFPTINVDPMIWGLVGIGLAAAGEPLAPASGERAAPETR
ncbi:MAG TPA: O-antigen ligase family protein, partial [Trueperaceae bacterium]